MSLSIVQTAEERLVSSPVITALREGIAGCGSAVLLVPSFAQALDAQRALAGEQGLSLSVATTTPEAWLKERWEVWGDGRAMVGGVELVVLAREAVRTCPPEERGPIEVSPGIAEVLSRLVDKALPWLPLDEKGEVLADRCAAAGLTDAETSLMGLAGRLGTLLKERGYVSAAEVAHAVPRLLEEAQADVPAVVICGFAAMSKVQRSLVLALAGLVEVTLVVHVEEGPAFAGVQELAQGFGEPVRIADAAPTQEGVRRDQTLSALRNALFKGVPIEAAADGPVEYLLAAGPVAEAELVARCVARMEAVAPQGHELRDIVVAVPDVERARRELVPKLAARGMTIRLTSSKPLLSCPAAQAYFSFARMVAHLVALSEEWPQPVMGIDGMMTQLGDMSWWPPREMTDFLLSDIAHVPTGHGWRADAQWRGNRLLTPMRVLATLQSERDTSAPVAQATQELLRGRLGSAASKLLLPYVESMGQTDAQNNDGPRAEARSALQAVLSLAGSLHELGLTADPSASGALPLTELVETCEWAAEGASVVTRMGLRGRDGAPEVRIMTLGQASRLAPGSADALIACGLTTQEQPIGAQDDLVSALLDCLGVEPAGDPMSQARAAFHDLVSVPRWQLVVERTLHNADAKEAYPSVMLSELLDTYGAMAQARPDAIPYADDVRAETHLGENLSDEGAWPKTTTARPPAPAGRLTEASRSLVFVPQDGSDQLPDGKPVLSASQVETYLECPYKWFSLRRLRLGQVDAGHTPMEIGTFAHRVMEVTHRELLLRALEASAPGVSREDLLADIEADPARHVAGSRVDASNIDLARAVLDEEFELHRQHMFMVKRPRQVQQLLVAHNSSDRAREQRLRLDLLSTLDYQTGILEGFEPRFFEWGFGRHGDLVDYAGAYFTGTVDRIDVSPHGTAVIIDYKHKSPAGFNAEYDALQEGVLEGACLPNRVQSLIYAQVVRRAFGERLRLVGSVYLSTKGSHALAGVADDNVADLVFGKVSSRRAPQVCVPRAADGSSGMDALLDQTEELVARAVEQMLSGDIEARPRDRRSCDYCPVMQCERRVAR